MRLLFFSILFLAGCSDGFPQPVGRSLSEVLPYMCAAEPDAIWGRECRGYVTLGDGRTYRVGWISPSGQITLYTRSGNGLRPFTTDGAIMVRRYAVTGDPGYPELSRAFEQI